MTQNYAHSPVSVFEAAVEDGVIVGYAAPQSGSPCLLRLSSDNLPISFAAAAGFSDAAAAAGLRSGWCGFRLHGLRQAVAVGERIEISCAASGRILKTLEGGEAAMPASAPAVKSLTVLDFLAEVREPRMCVSSEQLLPFALNHYRRHGGQSFRDMAYVTLLGRWPDAAAPHVDESIEIEEERILAYVDDLIESDEFNRKWNGMIPGPFHQDFRLDTTGLI